MTTVLLSRGTTFGDFRATGFVGSGGFSDVYEARDKDGRQVALKVLRLPGLENTDQQVRIERERQAISLVDSRGVARLIAADLQAEQPWIASEFVDGPTIRESVKESGPLGPSEVLALAKRLAEILGEVHQQGIAHRDITPNNVIFGPDGPVIIDFGSARIDLDSDFTGSVLLYGTTGFAPPEILAGKPAGRSADLFGLARTVQFCLSGKDDGEADLPPILQRCLSEDPDQRPSANELAETLANYEELPLRHTHRKLKKLPRRFRMGTLIAVSLLTVGLSALATSWLLASEETPTTEELLGLAQNLQAEVRGETEPVSVSAIPDSWEVGNIRVRDSVLADRPGDISAIQVRHGDWTGSGTDKPFTYGEVLVTFVSRIDSELFDTSSSRQAVLSSELKSVADQTVDLIESQYLPNGCSFIRAGETFQFSQTLFIWAAKSEKCEALEGREFATGLIWDSSSDLLGKWFVDSNDPGSIQNFVESIRIAKNFSPIKLSPFGNNESEDQNLSLTPNSKVDVQLGPGDLVQYPYYVSPVRLRPGEAVRIKNHVETSTQMSVYLQRARAKFSDLSWWAAGRWWAHDIGEQRVFINPLDEDVLFFFEVEAASASEDVEFRYLFENRQTMLLNLENSLGGDFSKFVTNSAFDEESEFALPDIPKGSSDHNAESFTFVSGASQVTFQTSLLTYDKVAVDSQGKKQTLVVRADDTKYVREFGSSEMQDPHWFVALADLAEVFFARDAYYWSRTWETNNCLRTAEWEIPTSQGQLFVQAVLGCQIRDSFDDIYRRIQAVPIYRFALSGGPDDYELVIGSFVPESVEELGRFTSFLTQLVSEADNFDYENSLVDAG